MVGIQGPRKSAKINNDVSTINFLANPFLWTNFITFNGCNSWMYNTMTGKCMRVTFELQCRITCWGVWEQYGGSGICDGDLSTTRSVYWKPKDKQI